MIAADIKAALLKRYAAPGHRVFFEVSNDTGTAARRWIDAVAVGIWPSTGHEIVGIEIKVSRSDWLRELQQPQKAQELMRFCSRWYLACPEKMVKPDELPATWGMLALTDGGRFKVTTAARQIEPEPLTAGFMMAVLRQANAVDMELVGRLVKERVDVIEATIQQRVEREVRATSAQVRERTARVEIIAEKIAAYAGGPIDNWDFDPKAFAAAYRLMKQGGLHSISAYGNGAVPVIIKHLASAQKALSDLFDHPELAALRAEMAGAVEKEGREA